MRCRRIALANIAFSGLFRGHCDFNQPALFPSDIHLESASGAESFDASIGPLRWEGGQEVDLALVRLEQHFADAGGDAKIAVNLHRRVEPEQIQASIPV